MTFQSDLVQTNTFETPPAVGGVQTARPSEVVGGGSGNWSATGSGTPTNLSDQSDSTYYSTNAQRACLGRLTVGGVAGAVIGRPDVTTGHTLYVRSNRLAAGTGVATLYLYVRHPEAGWGVQIASISLTTSDIITEQSVAVDGSLITSYGDLYFYLSRGSGTHQVAVYDVWLEVPAATPVQIVRPISSLQYSTNGVWSTTPNLATTDKWQVFADQDDATYGQASSTNKLQGRLGTFPTPPQSDTDHIMYLRGGGSSGTGATYFHLYQGQPDAGGTLIASLMGDETSAVSEQWHQQSYELTTLEAAAITNYADLWYLLDRSGGLHAESFSDIWFETPALQVADSATLTGEAAVVTSPNLKVASDTASSSDVSAKAILSLYPAPLGNFSYPAQDMGVRLFDYCQNGIWWVGHQWGNGVRFRYSADNGLTWTTVSGMDIDVVASLGHSNFMGYSFFIDKDDYMHLVTLSFLTGSGEYAQYWRGTPDAGRTSYNWSYLHGFYIGDWGGGGSPDITAFRDPAGGWKAAYIIPLLSGGYWYIYVVQEQINSGGTYVSYNGWTDLGYINGIWHGSIDFRHLPDDPKAVQAATPSLYYGLWSSSGTISAFFNKLTYSGGSYSQASVVNMDGGIEDGYPGQLAYDGTRIVMSGVRTPSGITESQPRIWERDEANTTTTLRTPSNPAAGGVAYLAINIDKLGNISYYSRGSSPTDIKRNVYTRAAGTWSGWTSVTASGVGQLGSLKASPLGHDPIIYTADQGYFYDFGGAGEFSGWGIPI